MRLERLASTGFRNLRPLELRFDGQFVLIHGENAQGKTNLLESIWLVATLRGLRTKKHRELITWGEAEAKIAADVRHEGLSRTYGVTLSKGQRSVTLDGGPVSDLADYFSGIRAVSFTPEDGEIVSGEPGNRRRWLDRAAFTRSPAHLDVVRTYKRTLQQKSALLRSDVPDPAVLDVLDHHLAQAGALLAHRRAAILDELAPHIIGLHARIAGSDELRLRYKTTAEGEDLDSRRAALAGRLAEVRPREVQRQTTLAGPQLDDLELHLGDRQIRTFGSRGQIRSLVLSLKLAELVAAKEREQTPLFLLDDLSSELDRVRTEHLVEVLSQLGTQVFVTTTSPEHIRGLPRESTEHLQVAGGEVLHS